MNPCLRNLRSHRGTAQRVKSRITKSGGQIIQNRRAFCPRLESVQSVNKDVSMFINLQSHITLVYFLQSSRTLQNFQNGCLLRQPSDSVGGPETSLLQEAGALTSSHITSHLQKIAVLFHTVQYSTAPYRTVEYSRGRVQYRYSSVQYSTASHGIMERGTGGLEPPPPGAVAPAQERGRGLCDSVVFLDGKEPHGLGFARAAAWRPGSLRCSTSGAAAPASR